MEVEEKEDINCHPAENKVLQIVKSLLNQGKCREGTDHSGVRPSEYMKQMLFTTEDRTEHLLKLKRKQNLRSITHWSEDQNFEIIPPVIVFQKFRSDEVYSVTFTVRNISQISRYLKLASDPDQFFSTEFRGSCFSALVAPGLSHLYTVQFNPDEKRDYEYRLKFLTDAGSFTVPVIAIGPRAMLDFPDRFEMPATAVKIVSSKTILIRNVGNAPAIFCLYSNKPQFWIEPSKGRLEEEETLQFTTHFMSDKPGDFEAELFLGYESGEELQMDLRCSATNCSIRIDRGSVRMEETYLGMSRSKTVTIFNRSDYTVQFRWMRFKDSESDKRQKEEYKKLFRIIYDMELPRSVDLVHYNICLPDAHQLVCQRIYEDEIASFMNDNFRYKHTCFAFTPEEGEIWPQSSKDVTVLFYAMKVGEVSSTAYLEVSGREDRLNLSLYGMGKGPVLRLNVVTIDVGNIYLCSVHNYEIVAANKGHIAGTLVYTLKPSDFGGTVKITPPSLTLQPDEHKSFNLSFYSNRKGDFVERVDFVVKESLEVLTVHIKGSIICPTLHFSKDGLDFGTTALGFNSRQEVHLHNLSLVPVTFSITALNDGYEPPLIYEEFAKAHAKPSFPANPREFSVSPEEGVVSPHSSLRTKIIYTANLARSGRTMIRVDMWDSDSDPVTLPIAFCGKVAALAIKPSEVTIRFCFINFPYTRTLDVENKSDLDGYFCLVPQQISEDSPIVYSASAYQGFIKARQSKTINITVITRALGKQRTALEMLAMGAKSPVASCVLMCNGQGPVISTQPTNLDFGEVQVLEEKIMKLSLISDSPIPANFKATLNEQNDGVISFVKMFLQIFQFGSKNKKNSPWSVSPDSGEIAPNESVEIEVKLYLRDVGKHSDNVALLIVSSRTIPVHLTATGVGCSIVFGPNIFPTFDMGVLLSQQKVSHPIIMKNLGTRHYQVAWSNEPELRIQRGQTRLSIISKFEVCPLILDVPAEGTSVVHCNLRPGAEESVEENWYVFGQIQGQGKRELIGTSLFKVVITEPQVLFSKKELMFRIDVCPDSNKSQRTDELLITNRSGLNLDVQLAIDPPFYLVTETNELVQRRKIVLVDRATTKISVNFSMAQDTDNLYSRTYNGILSVEYGEHPNKDKIKCRASVNFPNLTLSPSDLIINCQLGSSAQEILTLSNKGPISVTYKLRWIEESVRVQRHVHSNYESAFETILNEESKIQDNSAQLVTDEDVASNRQDGRGDEPMNSLESSKNSPLSEEKTLKLQSEVSPVERNSKGTEYEVSYEEIKDFLWPIVEPYYLEDTESPVLKSMNVEPPSINPIYQIMDVIPAEGVIPPRTVQHVYFGFHGFEPMEINATAVCEIVRGPTEIINVFACADTIRFSVDKRVIDFGQQLFHEPDKKTFTLENHSGIAFEYKVDSCAGTLIDEVDVSSLKIEPSRGYVGPRSLVQLDVEHRPVIFGPIDLRFKLEVGHLMPLVMEVKAIVSLAQVCACIPCKNFYDKRSVELSYSAVQSLTSEFIVEKLLSPCRDVDSLDEINDISEEAARKLSVEGWCVISSKETFPRTMDIEMAVERCLTKKFIAENSYALRKFGVRSKKQPIPQLLSMERIIDMGYVIVGLTAHYCTTIINYGPWTAEVQFRRTEKNLLAKFGIVVQFKKATLMNGDTSVLHVTWQPRREKWGERSTAIEHTIFLEVARGCSIPITIKGTITYPYVSVSTKCLDFGSVLVGECLMLCFLVKNEGLVNCEWDAKLSNRRKKQEKSSFYVYYDSNVLSPGQSAVVRVCFKPRRVCYARANLNVTVNMGSETRTINLIGHGIERKLKIIEPVIEFTPIVPFTGVQEKTLTIENTCERPVEFFWRHLDRSFSTENRVAEVLAHYYQVEEILLPVRNAGETMPQRLTEFYDGLISEMASVLSTRTFGVKRPTHPDGDDQQEIKENGENERENLNGHVGKRDTSSVKRFKKFDDRRRSVKRRNGGGEQSNMKKKGMERSSDSSSPSDSLKNNSSPMSMFDELGDMSTVPPANDPEEIQKLLHWYIDSLQRKPDFRENMKDPVGDLLRNLEKEYASLNDALEPKKPEKAVCIIFHGAPFTEYQETACRSAKVLGIPVLCLNKAITEMIAFGETSSSLKLRQIIDDTYEEYLTSYEKDILPMRSQPNKERLDAEAIRDPQNGAGSQSSKLAKNEKPEEQAEAPKRDSRSKSASSEAPKKERETILRLHIEPDPLREFDKIPSSSELETLDPLSRYEYKVEAVPLLRKILSSYTAVASPRGKISGRKTARRKQGDAFASIGGELLAEVLRERLSMEDFKCGFVVQSLNNIFIDSADETLLLLLRIVGHVEYSLFVTFLNTVDTCNEKVKSLQELREDEESRRRKRIEDIEEMSLSEYNLLSAEDKKLYVEAILPGRKEEASRRRIQFTQRLMELKKKKLESHRDSSTAKSIKKTRTAKSGKNKQTKISNREEKSTSSKATSVKKEATTKATKSRDSSKHREESMSMEMEEIVAAMNQYYAELSAIENILQNWDPVQKMVATPLVAKNKIPRTAKSRDKGSLDTSREVETKRFHIWYVQSSDPWCADMYNIIVNQMKENSMAKIALPVDVTPEPDLRPKMFSILTPKNVGSRYTQTCDAYQLTSVSSTSDGLSIISEAISASDTNIQESHADGKGNRKTRRQRLSSKVEEQKSLNASTTESRNTNNVSTTETIAEETSKARWILQPNEAQKFKIRFKPKIAGIYEEIYALTIADGNAATYEICVKGIADIPRLDMSPKSIFSKTQNTKIDDIDSPTFFLDDETYDFGSLLMLQNEKRVHRREAEVKFRNISQVDAEVYFSLTGNNFSPFYMQHENLFIAPGDCQTLNLSAVATKLGSTFERLYICIKNNPKVETIELRSNGTRLDVELDCKQLSFDRVLLYRREFRILTVRSKCAVPVFWRIEAEKPTEPQITFSPEYGALRARAEQKVEFCYYGTKIGVIGRKTIVFKVFLYENDEDPILTGNIVVSGETYDVAVNVDHANPIDLKCVRVNFPTSSSFTIINRGNYEVNYVIKLESDEKLAKIIPSINLKESLEFHPVSGSVQPGEKTVVQVTFLPKDEFTLKESPILKCHLLDTKRETTLVAEFPLTVSLTAFYTRFRLYPCPTIDFGALAICTQRTMYLNVENTGRFPLHYSIGIQEDRHPPVIYTRQVRKENLIKKDDSAGSGADTISKKDKKSSRTEKAVIRDSGSLRTLKIGSITVTKTEGDVDVNQIDTVAIKCYPEFVGSQEEEIIVLVPDSIPEDRNGKRITLSVNSYVPSIDFQNLDAIFAENHVVDHIQDFRCPKEIGTHTVFAREERCLYFRYVKLLSTHSTCLRFYNRNVIPADVQLHFLPELLTPRTAKSDTFVVEPERECVPPMSHKTFTIFFTPTLIETFSGVLEAFVDLPPHLKDEKFLLKLVGESCVPEITIVEPRREKHERPALNFGRTLVTESNTSAFALENTGVIQAKVIVETHDDLNLLFDFAPCSDTQPLLKTLDYENDPTNHRCAVVRLLPGNVARFVATFHPKEIGKYEGQIRLFIVDNPYENLAIDLRGEAYMELVVLKGLELSNRKEKAHHENRNSNNRTRRLTSRQNSLLSTSTIGTLAMFLTYSLDYGGCFVNKMYKKAFKIANKSTDQWFRFQWSAHPDVVFVPSIGHLKYLKYKEITATFLASEATNHMNTKIECVICEIKVVDPREEIAWDDRQTEVQWEEMDSGIANRETDAEVLARKVVEPTLEPDHEVVPGTAKCIQVLLNGIVAYSEYSCAIREIHFKDTLMLQTRRYTFTLSNPGTVNTLFAWKINMDEEYPKRFMENSPIVTSRRRSTGDNRSGLYSESTRGILSTTNEHHRQNCMDDETSKLQRFGPLPAFGTTTEVKPTPNSRRASDLFSSTAGLTERSTDSWLEGNDLPFEIYPAEGSLLPGESVDCTLKFSPLDVFHYKAHLICRMENLSPKLEELVIPIVARSLLPYCHFDVQESDYITSGRRDPKLPGPVGCKIENSTLWENIRVIEFKVVGIGETHVKKFHLINPTADDYRFSWTDRTLRSGDEISNFHCTVSEGLVERGKRTGLAFTFLAEDVGVFESFWLFSIEKYNLESLFLLVGVVTEPSVHCLTVRSKLKPTVLGISVRDSIRIINDEDFPVPFRVLEESLHSEGKLQSLVVTPMDGTLAPKREQVLCVEYQSTRAGEFQFSVQCAVKLMKKPLTIFITASSYDIASSVSYADNSGQVVTVQEDKENFIDFDKLIPKESRTVKLDITNSGKMAFYYEWDLGMTPEILSKNMYSIRVSEKQGHVPSEMRSQSHLTLTIFQKLLIKNHPVVLKIIRGPSYRFIIKASAKKPCIEFSFAHYDFGPCYIQQRNRTTHRAELQITNCEDSPFIVECKFEELPHMSVNLEAISEALTAHSTISIPITFRPLKEVKYRECLVFTINTTVEKRIVITGEGITYKIRLASHRDKSIDLGSIPVNKTVIRKVPILNEGRAPVELKFGLMKYLYGYEEHRRAQNCVLSSANANNEKDLTHDARLQTGEPDFSEVLRIEPSANVLLRPNKRINVIVKFCSVRRMRPFACKVALETSSTVLPLFILRGSCIGAEFHLNRTYVPFGVVVQGCASETKIVLSNTGDVGARFKWNASKLPKEFQITPVSGYCSPGMDVNFRLKFQPVGLCSSIEGQASIEIEKYGSLNMKTTGGSCKLPEPAETLFFVSAVRDKQTKSVTIMNDTNLTWKLRPEVTGKYYDTEEVLHVSPKTSVPCAITYAPVVMNTEDFPHQGTILFKLPNKDTPAVYSLRGLSLPPRVLAKIARQFPAKTSYTESLAVYNWLDTQQRFECRTELISGSETQSKEVPLFNFAGNSKIDVPPKTRRDYRAVFHSYEEFNFHFRVTFTNHEGEYQFYEIEYRVTQPEVIETVKLTALVRSAACYALQLENPLKDKSMTYTAVCQHPCVRIHELPKTVEPLSTERVNIEYRPILPTDKSVAILYIYCNELGRFPYELRLKAVPALPEKMTKVDCTLGSSTIFSLPIKNYARKNAEFTITVDNDCFTYPKTVSLPALEESCIDVTYEPDDIENVTATLIVSSATAGEFVFPIIATYLLPKPSGPYPITEKLPAVIHFKNVFKETKTYDFVLDDPENFTTETSSVDVKQKQNITVKVKLRSREDKDELIEDKYPATGKLIIRCTDPKLSHINWIYYLREHFD